MRTPKKIAADVVEARRISIVDPSGRERISLACDEAAGGFAVVHLFDDRGAPRMTLQVDSEGNPSVSLWTAGNHPAVSISVNADRGNGIGVADGAGRPCVEIGVPAPGADPRGDHPNVRVHDLDGRRSWSAFSDEQAGSSSP